ncbi:MAG: CvpA family protein [Clostridia bacterium]|nr:CvpA family protein [Clostridia bacterium]
MAHMIDIILVAIIALIAFIGSKRGFVLTVFDLLSGIVSFIIAKIVAPYASVFVYDNFAKATVTAFLEQKYNDAQNAVTDAVSSVFGFLPEGMYTFAEKAGLIDASALSQDVLSKITTVAQLEEKIARPVVLVVLNIICFAAIACIALIALRIVGRLISKIISKIKIIGKLNSILGGVFGIVKGILYVFIIAVVLSIVSFSSETVASYAGDSYICSFAAQLIGL